MLEQKPLTVVVSLAEVGDCIWYGEARLNYLLRSTYFCRRQSLPDMIAKATDHVIELWVQSLGGKETKRNRFSLAPGFGISDLDISRSNLLITIGDFGKA